MDEKALDTLCYNFDQAVTVSDDNFKFSPSMCNTDKTLESSDHNSENIEGNSDLMDESNVSNDTQQNCSYQDQTLPIFEKILNLSNKVQNLRQEHETLCEEVKGITIDSFPGSEVFSALQNLSVEHDILKKKYHEECELMKKKYIEEFAERKRLYNELIELKGNIRVFCRCRPLNADETAKGFTSVVDFDSSLENELKIISSDSSKKQFKFDHVFKPEDNQEAVFVQTMPIVTSVLDGYNVCIFAYGQTGTGKTFTMEGTPENRGVNYRTLEELFRISNERSSTMKYELFVSMLEVYNERIRDLLIENPNQNAKKISNERSSTMKYELFVSMLEVYNERIRDLLIENPNQNAKKLEIKQSAEGTQEVPGLVEAHVYSTDEVWELLKSGSRARSVGSTNANELSSRSHCLLRVTVMGENLLNGHKTRSHLWLVDLAGSERVGRIEVEGERLKESQFINKSLSALGDVIAALASKTTHVPYRNSKLTHMLQSSLGGDCKTLMFVQISPSSADLGETLCSLNFATRVRGVEHGPARKQTDVSELLKYKQLAEKAKHDEKETKKLQDNLQSLQLRLSAREHICRTLQEKVRDLENQLAEERKTRLKQESRALAAASVQPSALSSQSQAQNTTMESKPPLAPSKLRLPLRRITNFMPPPSHVPPYKIRNSVMPARADEDENRSRTSMDANKGKTVLKARRGSIAVRPIQATNQVLQPKRRASSFGYDRVVRPEPSLSMKTPLNSSNSRLKNDRVVGTQSFVREPQRVWRMSRVLSPLSKLQKTSSGTIEVTPVGSRSSKFMGSPPSQLGSWKPKHPTVVALQKKHLVWSPLKIKAMKNNRKSFMSSRPDNF